MILVVLSWVATGIVLPLAGFNIAWAMAKPDASTNLIVGYFCLVVGIASLWINAWSTYTRGQIDEMKR